MLYSVARLPFIPGHFVIVRIRIQTAARKGWPASEQAAKGGRNKMTHVAPTTAVRCPHTNTKLCYPWDLRRDFRTRSMWWKYILMYKAQWHSQLSFFNSLLYFCVSVWCHAACSRTNERTKKWKKTSDKLCGTLWKICTLFAYQSIGSLDAMHNWLRFALFRFYGFFVSMVCCLDGDAGAHWFELGAHVQRHSTSYGARTHMPTLNWFSTITQYTLLRSSVCHQSCVRSAMWQPFNRAGCKLRKRKSV